MRKIKLVRVKNELYLNEVLDSYVVLDNGNILINENTVRNYKGWKYDIDYDSILPRSCSIYLYK